jgi:hypothetical protein
MSVRRLWDVVHARASVWWYVRQQQRATPGWPRIGTGQVGYVQRSLDPLWTTFDAYPHRLSPAQSTVLHVWAADGLIGNGGMRSLIESMGDRGPEVVRALWSLGLEAYAAAVSRTLELFPTAAAATPDERLSAEDAWTEGGPEHQELDRLEEIAWSQGDLVLPALVGMIREHPQDFPGSRPPTA